MGEEKFKIQVRLSVVITFALFSALYCFVFLAHYSVHLDQLARQFKQDYISQNYQSLSRSDTFALTVSLTALSGAANWVCIDASKNGTLFFHKAESQDCSDGLFQKRVEITNTPIEDVKIAAVVRPSDTIRNLFISLGLLTAVMVGASGMMVYLSQRQRYRAVTALAEKAKSMAHDVRSPVSAIRVFTQKNRDLDPFSRELLDSVTKRLSAIADEFLSFHRGNAGAISSVSESATAMNSNGITPSLSYADLCAELEMLVREKNLEHSGRLSLVMYLDSCDGNLQLRADATALMRIISNAINNSVEAIVSDHTVTISTSIEPDVVEVEIRDRGRGIPPDILNVVGKEPVTFGKEKGNGIALQSAASTLAAWGGRLSVRSQLGQGTTISFRLISAV